MLLQVRTQTHLMSRRMLQWWGLPLCTGRCGTVTAAGSCSYQPAFVTHSSRAARACTSLLRAGQACHWARAHFVVSQQALEHVHIPEADPCQGAPHALHLH